MATPTLSKHVLPGALGEILVDVRAGDRRHPLPAAVILHGFKGFKDWGMFPPLADRLARAGFLAVAYNASGSGVDDEGNFTRAERFGHNTFSAELEDSGTVLDALAAGALGTAPPSAVALVGHSRGGGTAVLRTATDARIGALVTWAAISSTGRWSAEVRRRWRAAGRLEVTNQRTGEVLPLYPDVLDDLEANPEQLDVDAHAARIRVPWLIVHGTGDETVPVVEARRLAAAAPHAELRLIEGAGHTFGAAHPLTARPAALEEVTGATIRFLSTALP